MGKEVGKKMRLRSGSAQTNSAFRKLFSLPPEEFLIDDFTCHLKRKIPLQIQLKYHMMSTPLKPNTCSLKMLLGIAWLKGAKHQKKAAKNVMANSANRLREMFTEVEKEIALIKGTS